jgi:hypothetical protein
MPCDHLKHFMDSSVLSVMYAFPLSRTGPM